jgi:hypothetical protein
LNLIEDCFEKQSRMDPMIVDWAQNERRPIIAIGK